MNEEEKTFEERCHEFLKMAQPLMERIDAIEGNRILYRCTEGIRPGHIDFDADKHPDIIDQAFEENKGNDDEPTGFN